MQCKFTIHMYTHVFQQFRHIMWWEIFRINLSHVGLARIRICVHSGIVVGHIWTVWLKLNSFNSSYNVIFKNNQYLILISKSSDIDWMLLMYYLYASILHRIQSIVCRLWREGKLEKKVSLVIIYHVICFTWNFGCMFCILFSYIIMFHGKEM
jgi:hypothetical protein